VCANASTRHEKKREKIAKIDTSVALPKQRPKTPGKYIEWNEVKRLIQLLQVLQTETAHVQTRNKTSPKKTQPKNQNFVEKPPTPHSDADDHDKTLATENNTSRVDVMLCFYRNDVRNLFVFLLHVLDRNGSHNASQTK
jgi:hypothetical protein